MNVCKALIKRNVKLFFKDKGLFFTSLITPAILLVLYATFLSNVYKDSFTVNIPEQIKISEKLVDGLVAGQLISSLLAVSCITVAFCSNFLMVQDKANGTVKDLLISPVRPSVLSISYYLATLFSTLIICTVATALCLIYVFACGWYLSALDVLLILADVILLSTFGTALSSLINFFLSSQGQISAVGTIVSAGYGFICGAYMPISSFSVGLQKVISFLPGTYGTSLLRNHAMGAVLDKMAEDGLPSEVINSLKDALDCNIYFFENSVSIPVMYVFLGACTAALIAAYVAVNYLRGKDKK